jgi:hypothetical protein
MQENKKFALLYFRHHHVSSRRRPVFEKGAGRQRGDALLTLVDRLLKVRPTYQIGVCFGSGSCDYLFGGFSDLLSSEVDCTVFADIGGHCGIELVCSFDCALIKSVVI